LRAGALEDRATFLRWDLLSPPRPDALGTLRHNFLFSFPQAQAQALDFLPSDGKLIEDPDGPGPLWETPVSLPLPEELNL
jgi:hypothetical protein